MGKIQKRTAVAHIFLYDMLAQQFILTKFKTFKKWEEIKVDLYQNEEPDMKIVTAIQKETGFKAELISAPVSAPKGIHDLKTTPFAVQYSPHAQVMSLIYLAVVKKEIGTFCDKKEIKRCSIEALMDVRSYVDTKRWCAYFKTLLA